jgi:hypothetical protein
MQYHGHLEHIIWAVTYVPRIHYVGNCKQPIRRRMGLENISTVPFCLHVKGKLCSLALGIITQRIYCPEL